MQKTTTRGDFALTAAGWLLHNSRVPISNANGNGKEREKKDGILFPEEPSLVGTYSETVPWNYFVQALLFRGAKQQENW